MHATIRNGTQEPSPQADCQGSLNSLQIAAMHCTFGCYMFTKSCILKPRIHGSFGDLKVSRKVRKKSKKQIGKVIVSPREKQLSLESRRFRVGIRRKGAEIEQSCRVWGLMIQELADAASSVYSQIRNYSGITRELLGITVELLGITRELLGNY